MSPCMIPSASISLTILSTLSFTSDAGAGGGGGAVIPGSVIGEGGNGAVADNVFLRGNEGAAGAAGSSGDSFSFSGEAGAVRLFRRCFDAGKGAAGAAGGFMESVSGMAGADGTAGTCMAGAPGVAGATGTLGDTGTVSVASVKRK